MNERLRNEVVMLHRGGASVRKIARLLRISRKTATRILREHDAARLIGSLSPDFPRPPKSRPSMLDTYDDFIQETVERYPDITAVRLLEELQERGFTGKYTIVRERLNTLRPKSRKSPVTRFETGRGLQAQMDYSPYTIDFSREGRRTVYAFSYVLGFSRRQYLRFVESQDFTTTIRQHVQAFNYFGGLAKVCLYDNMKVVVSGFDGDDPIYNTRFLAFATHYGYRPWACKRRRSQTKGKVERPFGYIEKNLLNARSFQSLDHLNQVTEWWLENRADVRIHRETKRRPIDLFDEEKKYLTPLPNHPYDTAEVVYRVGSVEGLVSYQNNFYSVPWQFIGELLAVRVTEREIIVYGPDLSECARHSLFSRSEGDRKSVIKEHRPRNRERPSREVLVERFKSLVPSCGSSFVKSLLDQRRFGKHEASRILGLLELYKKVDLVRAIERAHQYGAHGFSAIERILALRAKPRSAIEAMVEESREHLRDLIEGDRIEPRKTSEYQSLLEEEGKEDVDGQSQKE